jgi:hypothetical protein
VITGQSPSVDTPAARPSEPDEQPELAKRAHVPSASHVEWENFMRRISFLM